MKPFWGLPSGLGRRRSQPPRCSVQGSLGCVVLIRGGLFSSSRPATTRGPRRPSTYPAAHTQPHTHLLNGCRTFVESDSRNSNGDGKGDVYERQTSSKASVSLQSLFPAYCLHSLSQSSVFCFNFSGSLKFFSSPGKGFSSPQLLPVGKTPRLMLVSPHCLLALSTTVSFP